QHELSAAANRWIFVTPARMFLPLLSLSRILPAVMLSSGTENLLSYNKSLDASGGCAFLNLLGAAKGALIRAAAVNSDVGEPLDQFLDLKPKNGGTQCLACSSHSCY
ncbi:MAG TPA: hypothetical protein VN956_23355, partial [Pyrinomonadaceae bacterium]|nr:hypothetical protein [Pyrinomonadaceae bacterium]